LSSARLSIVHVVESLDIGGLEHMVVALSAAQIQAGHLVRIVCLWFEGPLAARAREAGVTVACCDKQLGLDARAAWKLRAHIKDARPDVLHTHNAMSHYYAVAATAGLGIRVVLSTRHGYGKRNLQVREERFYKQAMRWTDYGVSVSRSLRDYFVAGGQIPDAKAHVVANGIDVTRFTARSDERAMALRIELGLPHDAVTFATVGRLNEVKRQVDLLRAMRVRLDAGDQACLLIVGDGPMREELETECTRLNLAPHMRMLGARSDVPALLAAMDVFVLCSRSEGYSLALVEASTSALPIIATDVGGNAEIVSHENAGLIVPAADGPALAAAMGRLCADQALREAFGACGRAWALREGSLQHMCDAYEALYRKSM
jgi:glycosyltransferase involved in cell wall biosynthesis